MRVPRLDLRDLRFFVAVAEDLHFRKAAERLNVAQPHLSAQLREMELKIGARLFDRTTRTVTLSAAGHRLLGQARYTLQQVDHTCAIAAELSKPARRVLRIGFTPAASATVLPWILREFSSKNADVDVNIAYMVTAEQVRKLLDGDIDFGFLRTPVHTPELVTPTLAMESAVVALPRSHKLAGAPDVSLSDLANEKFMHFGAVIGFDFEQHIVNCCHRAGFMPDLSVRSSDTYSSITLVSAGFGVALLPEWVARSTHPEVVFKRLPEIPPFIPLSAAWRSNCPSAEHEAFRAAVIAYANLNPLVF